jgi:hypothetical protein
MDELFAESVFTACCMLLWHIKAAVSDLYLRIAKADSKPRLPVRACLVDAGGSIVV